MNSHHPNTSRAKSASAFLASGALRAIAMVFTGLVFSLNVLPPSLCAQTYTATTTPVGFIQTTVAAATGTGTPSYAALSVPFYGAAVQTGTISSLSGTNSLSVSNASWTANQYAYTTGTTPYYLLLNSGSNTGRYFLITSNSTSQLTVNTNGYSFVTGAPTNSSQIQVQVNDSVGIVPANTLSGVFGTGASCVLATGPSASSADNVILWNGATWNTYYNNGTNWKQSGSLLNQDYAPTAPDAGVFIVRTATTSVNLVVGGTVPTTAARSDLPGQGYSFFINRFPLDTTLSALGLQAMSNWQSGSSASSADNVFLWIGSTWASFYYNGTNWKQAGSLLTFDTQAVPAGSALLIWRQSSAAGSAATLVQTLPYSF